MKDKVATVTKRARIDAIDLLRGLFIIVMTIDHIARFPNGLDYFSGRNQLWFSAAEGFVALSGLLVGYIYMPKILHATRAVFKKLLKRAALLYACVISLALFFIAYSYFFLDAINFRHFSSPFDLLFQLLTLQYSFGWAEFLTHYVIFLIAAPFVLYLFAKRYGWLVLTVSSILWIVGLNLSENQTRYEFTMSWQFLFVIGMFLGGHLDTIKQWLARTFSHTTRHHLTICLWGVGIVLYATAVLLAYGASDIGKHISPIRPVMQAIESFWTPINEHWFHWWTDKATLAPLRIIFGIVIFWAMFLFFDRFSKQINRVTDGILMTFGKKPLVAYCVGATVIFFIEKYLPKPAEENRHFVANLIVTLCVLTVTYLITKNSHKLRSLFYVIVRNRQQDE